ncbi:MAG: patatin-like phospholipase family protein [Patescibacteria group bacterium]|nr:patatin-like phospholipase family protein [Patescibacteria group bacterium]MDE2438565.1 patatin-like phospholipase family protein [Patescibacteria group bacterium]
MNAERVGIILPSGGCKCAFQAGALQAIAEYIPASHICYLQGVSGGILNAAKFISDDFQARALIQVWRKIEGLGAGKLFDLFTVLLNQIGKNTPNQHLEDLLGQINPSSILKSHAQLDIVVRNTRTNKAELFSSHNLPAFRHKECYLRKLILASASIPGIMPGVYLGGHMYCDGFVLIPEALHTIKDQLDIVLVIDPEHQTDPFTPDLRPPFIPSGSWKSLGGSHYIYLDNLEKSITMLRMIVGEKKVYVIKPTRTYPHLTPITFAHGEITDIIEQGYALTTRLLRSLQ